MDANDNVGHLKERKKERKKERSMEGFLKQKKRNMKDDWFCLI